MRGTSFLRLLQAAFAGMALSLAAPTAQAAADSGWFARPWQSDDGLPNNTVAALAQTPDGFLWLGTASGLVRFDGVLFEDFSPTNFVAPPNRGALVMLLSRGGALWLAMDRGAVVRLEGGHSRAFTNGLPNFIPNGLAEDPEGTLWVAYRGGDVYRLKGAAATRCTEAEGLPSGPDPCALATDSQGRVWFAKGGQVGTISNGFFSTAHRFDAQPARLAACRAGGVWLWVGPRLYQLQAKSEPRACGELRLSPAGTLANVMLEDREGAVWIGTSFGGLFRHKASRFETVETTHQEILALAEDSEGNLWVGTGGGGLNRVRRRAVVLEDQEDGLPFPAVQSLCQDGSGALWAVTQNGGLARRVGDKWMPLPLARGGPADATCVAADPQGSVWVGSRREGLFCWREGRFVSWGDASQLASRTLHTLLVSRAGDLWMGEQNPAVIQRFRGGQLTTFELPQDGRSIRAMAEDAAGNIWAGTSKGLLFCISGDKLVDATPRSAHDLAPIRCLYATPDGTLWIGYAGWGLGRLSRGRYAEIGTEDGLYDNFISHIVADDDGWLWFGADRGIFKGRLQDLGSIAKGGSERVFSVRYGRGEGLPSLQGTFGAAPGALRSRDGRLWIPMRTALAVVDPGRLSEAQSLPPLLLSRVAVDGRTVAWYGGVLPPMGGEVVDLRSAGHKLRLSPGHRRIDFEFAALGFTDPQNVQCRYRLEGLGDEWRDAVPRRGASYSRLPPGDYRFEVIASSRASAWTQPGARLDLVVSPFFWQTWWFRSIALTGFSLALAATVRYTSFRRLRRQLRVLEQQAALHRERARIAKDIHDDLGANLTQIALLGDLAQQDRVETDKAGERIDKISGTARQAIRALDEIVWAVNPRNDTLAHLVDYAGQFALDYLRLAGIRCRLELPEQTPARELSTDLRHNLFLVIKEAVHNIVKHARATEVRLAITATDEALEVRIEDNGCGFTSAPDNALSDGLRNMRQRLAEVGGECSIESRAGAGTSVRLRLPWPAR